MYHVTAAGAWPSIRQHGLLAATRLMALCAVDAPTCAAISQGPRAHAVSINHPVHGRFVLNDQQPIRADALAACLDDGLSVTDWLAMLNARVFFWSDVAGLRRLLNARSNRVRAREVLVFDTYRLAVAHADRLALSPINSGSTMRRAVRRGLSTFTPLGAMSYAQWSRQRGRRDRILEVTVRDGIMDIENYLIDVCAGAAFAKPVVRACNQQLSHRPTRLASNKSVL